MYTCSKDVTRNYVLCVFVYKFFYFYYYYFRSSYYYFPPRYSMIVPVCTVCNLCSPRCFKMSPQERVYIIYVPYYIIIIYTVRRTMTGEAVAGRATRNFRRLPAASNPAPASICCMDDRATSLSAARERTPSRSRYLFICILFIKIIRQISTGRCLCIPHI